MDRINLDSDCEIIEPNVSIITIDSQYDACQILDVEIEDGEVEDVIEISEDGDNGETDEAVVAELYDSDEVAETDELQEVASSDGLDEVAPLDKVEEVVHLDDVGEVALVEKELAKVAHPDKVAQVADRGDVSEAAHLDNAAEVVAIDELTKVAELDKVVCEPKKLDDKERSPVFEVKFRDKSAFQELGHNVLRGLESAINEQSQYEFKIVTDDIEGVSIRAFVGETKVPAENYHIPETTTAPPRKERFDKEQSPDLSDLSTLFMIDTEPAEKLDIVKIPSYKRVIKDVLDEESRNKKTKNEEDICRRPQRASGACFNCGATDHSIRECPKPRNLKRINRAKKAFSTKQDRYHVDIEQRFAHLRPGAISDKLKAAMGVRRGELPFFIYRMRVLGYPPGWLEDAKVAHSGISLFSSDGTEVLKPDEDPGEVDAIDHKYDTSKIVEFPGYNLDPGSSFYDDYKHYNVPPLNAADLKTEFIKTLGGNILKGYKRKKLIDLPSASDSAHNVTTMESTDMDIEDPENQTIANVIFTRPLPPAEPPNDVLPPPPPTTPENPIAAGKRPRSPTLADLEAEQLKLLQELKANTSTAETEPDDSLIDEVLALNDSHNKPNVSGNAAVQTTPCKRKADEPAATPQTPCTPVQADIIKESHMGTPLLKFSPFDQLPAGDNFKVGVSDVINFENLPDSTGKYEQMKVVIKKVRNKITQLNNEED